MFTVRKYFVVIIFYRVFMIPDEITFIDLFIRKIFETNYIWSNCLFSNFPKIFTISLKNVSVASSFGAFMYVLHLKLQRALCTARMLLFFF